MKIENFNKYDVKKKTYGGANGNKLSIVINDDIYMLKFPQRTNKKTELSYANSCISEYIGSNIFNILGVKAQNTILGTYTFNDIERITVACKDFENEGYVLKDFASVKNQIVDSTSNGYGTELTDILETIEKQVLIDPVVLSKHFWKMFVIDALIGNWDRHNGNWGFLYNQTKDDVRIAPIFDCGSCLYPQIDGNTINKVLSNSNDLKARIYDIPTSAICLNGKRINYYKFINSHEYSQCDEAINNIIEIIDFNKINKLIDDIECIDELHKTFYKEMLEKRYKAIFLNEKI